MTRQALDLLCSRLPDVAAEMGVSLASLRAYRTRGKSSREPSPETARALAGLMKRRARALDALAGRLEREVAR